MNTDSVLHDEDEPSQPLVQWYPRGGALRSPDVVAAAAVGLALFAIAAGVAAAVILTRRAHADDD